MEEHERRQQRRTSRSEVADPSVATAALGEVRAALMELRAGVGDLHRLLQGIRAALADRGDCGPTSCVRPGHPPDDPVLWAAARRAHRAAGIAMPLGGDQDEPVTPAAALASSGMLAGPRPAGPAGPR